METTIISMIVAMDFNFLIGARGKLPWEKIPADMKRFREKTLGKPVVMGRKAWESLGKPLSDRTNIVLTRDYGFRATGCVVVHSVDEALVAKPDAPEIVIIGGAQIYKLFAPMVNRLYLTFISTNFENGDTYFPFKAVYLLREWSEIREETEALSPNDETPYHLLFQTFVRKSACFIPSN